MPHILLIKKGFLVAFQINTEIIKIFILECHFYNCSINLQEEVQPLFVLIYNLLYNKLDVFKKYIDENLAKNFICHSKSLIKAPILFVKKKWISTNL